MKGALHLYNVRISVLAVHVHTCAELSPLLAWFGSLALEGASGPLLELGRSLLVGGGRNGCVGHLLFVCYQKNQEEVKH